MKVLTAIILFSCLLWIRFTMPLPVFKKGREDTRDYGEVDTNWIFIIVGSMILAALLMKVKRKK